MNYNCNKNSNLSNDDYNNINKKLVSLLDNKYIKESYNYIKKLLL